MHFESLATISQQLASRQISSVELTQHFLERIKRINPLINSFICLDEEGAMEAAAQSDQRRARATLRSSIDGIPLSIKDILCTRRMPTTCGSRILKGYQSPFDATVVEKLIGAGMIVLGKTNLDEFAMGGSTETSCFGVSRNPWEQSRTCGGSSGGSAASVAAGLVPASVGTDTGGSIRQPAAFCGVCGLKPTYGRVSRYGLVAYASSLDQAGPFGQTVPDLATMLGVMAGHDERDSTSLNIPMENLESACSQKRDPLVIGIVREHLEHPGLDPEIRAALEMMVTTFQRMGHKIVDLQMPHHRFAVPTYYLVAPSEASSNLSRFDGAHFGFRAPPTNRERESALVDMYKDSRSQGLGTEVKRRIMLGTFALSAGYSDKYYLKALQVRRLIRGDYDRAFEQVDVIIGPTTPTPAFCLGEKVNDPVQMYLEDLYTVSANLAGIPALSIPVAVHSTGLPLGLQFQAAPLQESKLLWAAHEYHREIHYKPKIALN